MPLTLIGWSNILDYESWLSKLITHHLFFIDDTLANQDFVCCDEW